MFDLLQQADANGAEEGARVPRRCDPDPPGEDVRRELAEWVRAMPVAHLLLVRRFKHRTEREWMAAQVAMHNWIPLAEAAGMMGIGSHKLLYLCNADLARRGLARKALAPRGAGGPRWFISVDADPRLRSEHARG
jgi:hypothetical protein